MATKRTTGKTNGSARDAAPKPGERMFRVRLGDQILTVRLSLASVPVGGKGPRPKKDDLLLMLTAVLAELLGAPRPPKRKDIGRKKALVGGKGRRPPGSNP